MAPPRRAQDIGYIYISCTSHPAPLETGDAWAVQGVIVILSNSGAGPTLWANAFGNPLQKLTGDLPVLVLDNPNCLVNVLGPQPGTGRLRGFVDLHTHPLANLGFGGKLLYGGVDVGSLLPADPDCNKNVRAQSMVQALGHDASTHGSPIGCGDVIRAQVIHALQTGNGAKDESEDARGAPDFLEWPAWNDITHQKMWVDWIRRSYCGGLRVMVALALNNQTLGEMTAGPSDFPADDKSSADRQITELKAFVGRHADFMQIASSSADLEQIVRANKLAVIPGVEIDNIGNFNKVSPLTEAEISAEIGRLFEEGVRYIFPVHLVDNPFGGTAAYQHFFNYSNFRESGHWWILQCASNITYQFASQNSAALDVAVFAKLGTYVSPPPYPSCAPNTGQVNALGLTDQGKFAIKEMMRLGMLIDIDHMSDRSKSDAIAVAKSVGSGYPLNSGHCGLRILGDRDVNERSTSADQYQSIAALHGMAGIGSANHNAYEWVDMYRKVIAVMGPNAVAGFGTDTDGMALGMPPRSNPNSSVQYNDSFPRSRLGTRCWDYNQEGVAHYGMLPDFLMDARTAPGGTDVVDNNLMFGADYLLQTWKRCEEESQTMVPRTNVVGRIPRPLPPGVPLIGEHPR